MQMFHLIRGVHRHCQVEGRKALRRLSSKALGTFSLVLPRITKQIPDQGEPFQLPLVARTPQRTLHFPTRLPRVIIQSSFNHSIFFTINQSFNHNHSIYQSFNHSINLSIFVSIPFSFLLCLVRTRWPFTGAINTNVLAISSGRLTP